MDPVKIGGDIKAIVFKYATRLLKLQVGTCFCAYTSTCTFSCTCTFTWLFR